MKRRITFLLTACLLLLSGFIWGQTRAQINWVASEQGYENGQVIDTVEFDSNVSAIFNKGTNNNGPKYYNTGQAIRCYGSNYFTMSTTQGTLSEIALTFGTGDGSNEITTDVGTFEDGIWTGSSSSVTFTIGGTTGHRRIAAFDITYSSSGVQSVATPTFSPVGGTYGEPQTVTISCSTSGATIYYTTNGSNPTTGSSVYSSPLTISETTTVKAMAVKSGMNNSNVATATYTIQQMSTITTISGIWDLAESVGSTATPANVTFNNWYVTGVRNNQVCISDGQLGFVIYQASHGFTAGDKLNGTVSCNVLLFQNRYAELTGVHASDLTVTPNQEMPIKTTTIGALEVRNYGTPIDLGNLTYNGSVFEDESGTPITPYNNFNLDPNPINSLESGQQYHVKGVYIIYWSSNGTVQQVAPRNEDDFEETGSTTQTVATPTFNPAAGTYNQAQSVTITCSTSGATIYYTTNGSNPTTSSSVYSAPLTINETTTVKAMAVKSGMNNSNVATATYTIQSGSSLMTIAEARALENNQYALVEGVVTFIDGRNVYVQDATAGIDLYLNATAPSTLALGDKVQAYGMKAVYKGLVELSGIEATDETQFHVVSTGNQLPLAVKTIAEINSDFAGSNALQATRVQIEDATIGAINTNGNTVLSQGDNTINIYRIPNVDGLSEDDIVTINCVIGCFNTVQLRVALASDVTFTHSQTDAVATPTFTPEAGTFNQALSVTISCATQGASIYYTLDGSDPTASTGTAYTGAITINQTTTVKAIGVKAGMEDSEIATAVYTIVPPAQQTEYTLITSANALVAGDKYIIVGIKGEGYKALGKQAANNRTAVDVTPVNNVITLTPATTNDDGVFELTLGQEEGNWTLFDAVNGGYLYAASSSSNYLRTQATNDANGQWTIEIDAEGVATIKAQGENTRNWLRLNNNGTPFSCYTSGQLDVYLYKAGDVPTPPSTVATPVFSLASGAYTEPQQLTITCATQGATIHYTLDGSDPTENSAVYSTALTISETTTVKAMATKEGLQNSAIASATYTFLTPMSIAEARSLENNEYALLQGVVTFIDGRNVYIQDESAGIDLFLNNNTVPSSLALGDMVLAYGKKTVYNGLVELSGINGNEAGQFNVISSGNTLPVAEMTIEEILEDFADANMLQSTRVQIVDATIGAINNNGNTPITQDGNTLNLYKMPVVEDLLENDLVTVTGVIGCFNNPQLRIASADDVLFEHPIYPVLAATPNTLTGLNYDYEEGGPSAIMSFALSGNNLEGSAYVYPSEHFEISSGAGEYFVPENRISISGASHFNNIMVYVRLKAGLEIGTYDENLTASSMNANTISIHVNGSVTTDQPPVLTDYARLTDVSQLVDGAKVIFAARFDENANEYYAMTNHISGKIDGVLFTSAIAPTGGETLPDVIADEEELYYWTVTTDGTNYTFTNAEGNVLGYNSGTNFTSGGDNTAWTIEFGTADPGAMVPEYQGFVVTNANNTGRAFALNATYHSYGAYSKSNMTGNNAAGYNFYLDMFAISEGGTLICATPSFTPEGGTYYEPQEVTINCATADATIYYTLDGSDPTVNSMVYDEPILVSENTTIKAFAMKEGYEDSGIAEAQYAIVMGAAVIFDQDWEGDMNGWTFVTVEGGKPWTVNQYNGNHYAYANGYNGGVNEQWCISPAFNLDNYSDVSLTFMNAKNYTGPDLQLFFSNDYDGADPTDATWTELSFNMSSGSYTWAESGTIELTGFSGDNCYIGFKYTSTADQAAAWEVDDITLMGFTTMSYLTATPNALSGFTHVIGEGPSASQYFTLTAGNITPAPGGGSTGSIIIRVISNAFEISFDDETYTWQLEIDDVTNLAPTPVYVRMNGEEVGQYAAIVEISASSGDDATVSLSGTVTEPIQGGDWNRIGSLEDLHDGDQVVIAARYDATVGDGYYAMTAGVSGKPDGVLFTSVIDDGVETLPDAIVADIETFVWNVTVNDTIITLTNAAGDVLGYSSSTNFAGNTSTDWSIRIATSGDNAMVPNYTGFLITNVETNNRCIVMNANHKFGAYHTNNINNGDYNFYLDLFVQGGSATQTVATPVFSTASGTYYEEIDVEISCATEGASIYYTTDGTTPDASSELYTGPIHVDADMTIKAIGILEGYENSNVATANYVIVIGMNILFTQDWEGDMNGWTFVTVEGNKPWNVSSYGGNYYAYANGYNDNVDNEQWCISPAFNLTRYEHATLTFRNAKNYNGPDLELYFSNNYDGQDPTHATWEPLQFNMSTGSYSWAESGEISLDAFNGQYCYIGFRYISTLADGAAAWEIDDILLCATTSTNVSETTMMDVVLWNHNDEIFVENNTGNDMQMMVFNLLCQPVLTKTVGAGSIRFSHNLSDGMYIVTLQQGDERMSTKMIVR